MNFQVSFPQADLKASLLSAAFSNQTPTAFSLGNYSAALLKNQQLQLLSNQLADLQQQSFPRSQIRLPQVTLPQLVMKASQPMISTVEAINPLIASPMLDSALIAQINRAKLIEHHRKIEALRQEAKISASNQAMMLSGLLEKYSSLRSTETLIQNPTTQSSNKVHVVTPNSQARQYNPIIKFSQKRARRKAADIQRTHKCPYKGCEKTYGTEASMIQHYRLKHPGAEQNNQIEIPALSQSAEANLSQLNGSKTHDGVQSAVTSTFTPILN